MARQDRDAVLLAQDADRRLEMQIHPEMPGHAGGLIRGSRVNPPDANLLQGDDVGIAGCDHLRNPRGSNLPVGPKPPVNIVGQDSDDPPLFLAMLQRSAPTCDRVDRYAAAPAGTSEMRRADCRQNDV